MFSSEKLMQNHFHRSEKKKTKTKNMIHFRECKQRIYCWTVVFALCANKRIKSMFAIYFFPILDIFKENLTELLDGKMVSQDQKQEHEREREWKLMREYNHKTVIFRGHRAKWMLNCSCSLSRKYNTLWFVDMTLKLLYTSLRNAIMNEIKSKWLTRHQNIHISSFNRECLLRCESIVEKKNQKSQQHFRRNGKSSIFCTN